MIKLLNVYFHCRNKSNFLFLTQTFFINQTVTIMKKILLLTFALFLGLAVFSQAVRVKPGFTESKAPNRTFNEALLTTSPQALPPIEGKVLKSANTGIILRQLSNSANGFGFLGSRQTIWANDDINTVTFVHRMEIPPNGPGSGYLAIDHSTDRGTTWTINTETYSAAGGTLFGGRYPEGGFYNPAGNTDPNNAYHAHFAAVLDQSNGGQWGGYGYGTKSLTAGSTYTQFNVPTSGDFLQGVPSAYTISNLGRAICADPAKVGTTTPYMDNMILTTGLFNETTGDFDMDRYLVNMPAGGLSLTGVAANVADVKVAFAPDGMIGYIAMLSNNDENGVESIGCYYPILYKTTDGGDYWDGPYNVELGGIDGIPAVLNYLSDELIETLFEPPLPAREDIPFSTAFDFGLTVDYAGNPHMIFDVGVGSQEWSLYTQLTGTTVGCEGMVAMMHVFSLNGGEDWIGDTLCLIHTFRGEFPYTGSSDPVSEDNKPMIGSTMDGTRLFFSWIDTDLPDNPDNNHPDIYCVGYDAVENTYSDKYCVTTFSAAWYSAWEGAISKYVFDNSNGTYTIPFIYQQVDPADFAQPVTYWYVDNFILSDEDLGAHVGYEELEALNFTVSQNYPNPCADFTFVDVRTNAAATLNYDITNLLGQTVWKSAALKVNEGKYKLTLQTSGLEAGVYFYNVRDGKNVISNKLIIN